MNCQSAGCGVRFGLLNWKHRCGGCGGQFCSSHIAGRSDVEFWKHFSFVHEGTAGFCSSCLARFSQIKTSANSIELWSANYKGQVRYEATGRTLPVSSGWHERREDCDRDLRIEAAFQGMEVVFHVKYEKGSASSGNYRYTTWMASGVAGLLGRLDTSGGGRSAKRAPVDLYADAETLERQEYRFRQGEIASAKAIEEDLKQVSPTETSWRRERPVVQNEGTAPPQPDPTPARHPPKPWYRIRKKHKG